MYLLRHMVCAGIALVLGHSFQAHAGESTKCYKIKIKNSPERDDPIEARSETWCYQHLLVENKLFIYNADQNTITPAMSLLVDADGLITHASLLAGEISIHQVNKNNFNPFSIPLQEPQDQMPIVNLSPYQPSIESVRKLFQQADVQMTNSFLIRDIQNLSARANILPWQGFWYPRKNMPMLAPLSKYDLFVQARTGTNPGSVSWERQNHPYHGVGWSGHCNGWAAASILHREPRVQKIDSVSGASFSVSDQKGILTEADYCVGAAFFGNRNYGAGNNGDIQPDLFHKTILYYIGALHKPVIMDYHSDSSVDNHVVSGYDMNIIPEGNNKYHVRATLYMHGYDNFPNNAPGVARPYQRIYNYILFTDPAGNPIGGQWLSENPDFVWVPLDVRNCQKLDYTYINQILNL